MSVPIGLGKLHANGKISFLSTDTLKSVVIDPVAEDQGMRIMPNPSSQYLIYIHNPSSQTATIKVFNTWVDIDGNSRQTDLTEGGTGITAASSGLFWVSGLFMGEDSKIEASIPSAEGSAFNIYYQVRRP